MGGRKLFVLLALALLLGLSGVARAEAPAPADVTGTPGNNSATLRWSPVLEAVNGYEVVDASDPTKVLQTVPQSDSPSAEIPGVNGVPGSYRVHAVDATGQDGLDSEPVTVTPNGPLPAPANFKGTPGDNVATLSWDAVAGAKQYEILDSSDAVIKTVADATPTDVDGTNGVAATYKVRAVDTADKPGNASAPATVTPNGPLPAPANFKGTPGDNVAKLSWDAVAGAAKYEILDSSDAVIKTVTTTT